MTTVYMISSVAKLRLGCFTMSVVSTSTKSYMIEFNCFYKHEHLWPSHVMPQGSTHAY